MSTKISGKNWALLWTLGLTGQLCWSVEGSWFNNFVYDKISPNPSIVAWMVAVSAITTTVATFLLGTLGDRLGKRQPFVGLGFILWGVFTVVYGSAQFIPKSSIVSAAVFVVAADGIMSFFGSFGYHGSFNPWTTDISDESNRGKVGAVAAAVPVISSIVSAALFGVLIDKLGFFAFFTAIGGLVTLIGLASLFLLQDSPTLKPRREGSYWRQFFSIFNPSTVRKNPELFWLFVFVIVYNVAFNVYYPYISIFLVNSVGLSYSLAGALQGGSLLIAVALTIPATFLIDRGRPLAVLILSTLFGALGLLGVALAGKSLLPLALGIFGAGLGYILYVQTTSAWFKNLLPEGSFGQFEGLRMVFAVCLPMIFGPAIATQVIQRFGRPSTPGSTLGQIPTASLFVAAALLTLLNVLPLVPLARHHSRRQRVGTTQ